MTADSGFAPVNTDPFTPDSRHVAVVSGGLGDPSTTRLLADRLMQATAAALSGDGILPVVEVVELRLLAGDIADALVANAHSGPLAAALATVSRADGVIAVTPTFKAGYSGLFKSFWDLVDDKALAGVPVLLGATGGTQRHSLMIDTAMRPLFAYLRARTLPHAVFAASDDWGEVPGAAASTRATPLEERIAEAGDDLAEALTRLAPRPRPAVGEPAALEVTPFRRLLRGDRF